MSGGPDSLGLLRLALDRAGRPLSVATFDHGLRDGSAEEAEGVARLCASLGVPHATLRPAEPIPPRNVQAAARAARYAALARWAADERPGAVATGHQMDDRAETLAMRLARGSGLRGLAAMRERVVLDSHDAPSLTVIRPCLTLRRAELAEVVASAGWDAVHDPANADPRHDRARMRRDLPAAAIPGLARSAAALAEAADALAWAEERAADRALHLHPDRTTLDPAGLPPALIRALLQRSVAHLRPGAPPARGPELDRLLSALRSGTRATLRGLSFAPGRHWTVRPAPPAAPRDCKPRPSPYLHPTTPAPDAPT